ILPFLLMVAAIAGVMAAFGTDAEDSSQADDTTDIVFLGELDLAERAGNGSGGRDTNLSEPAN
ncbi:MAG: hypothetical protein J6Y19_10300, partial [Kiritimatiellae bacterium]|nr:hypothetical protein [Kiritimatiellia bacterium]